MGMSVIPISENKNSDTSEKNNYRPIAIVTVISKLFELCLSKILDKYVCSSENHLAVKTNILLMYAYMY